jgi:hypothetical protein
LDRGRKPGIATGLKGAIDSYLQLVIRLKLGYCLIGCWLEGREARKLECWEAMKEKGLEAWKIQNPFCLAVFKLSSMLEGREAITSDRIDGWDDQLHSLPSDLQTYQPESQEAVWLGSYQSDRTKGRDDPLRSLPKYAL